MDFKNKFSVLYRAFLGLCIRTWYSIFGFHKKVYLNSQEREVPVIVSLTSYGRRVTKTLPFALISLLRQRLKPDLIIVWLDEDNWSDENLPKRLQTFRRQGVEFRFWEDIRSYKKLIPAIIEYPDAIIVTVDDDIYYRSSLLHDLYNSYLLHPQKIHAAITHQPLRDSKGELLPYNSWIKDVSDNSVTELFPTGCGGCLYPPGSLYKDTTNKELFMKLCPNADDVWFWVMARLQSTKHVTVQTKQFLILDLLYEFTHKDAALQHKNVYENANDVQLKQVLQHYDLK